VPALAAFVKTGKWPGRKPPLWEAAASESGKTANHQTEAMVVQYLTGDPKGRERLLARAERERREGHMLREGMSSSHWQHHAAAWAAALAHALRIGDAEVVAACLGWFADNTALNLRMWERGVRSGSTVSPCARGNGGWKAGAEPSAEQWSWMRDRWTRYLLGQTKRITGNYEPTLDAHCVELLSLLPREEIL